MSAPCADSCLKGSLQEAPFRDKSLLAWLILRAYQDEHGLVRLPQQELANHLDIRHPRNLAPILRPLTETGHLMIIPGRGRGHPTRYLLTKGRTDDVLLAILTTRVGLTEEEARERLEAWRMEQKSPAGPELLTAHAQHDPTRPPPKSAARAEPLANTSATAEPSQTKRTATAVVLSQKPSAPEELFQKTSGIEEPFATERSATAALFPKNSGVAEPFVGKRTAPAELFTASSLGNASLDRARAGPRAHDLAAANNKPIQKIKQQQQQSLRADLVYARGAGSDAASNKFTLQDAFQHADIQPPTTRYIVREWRERTGRDITPEDVLAWHFYRLRENQRKRRSANPLEPGYIIIRMRQGEQPGQVFYDQAREFLHNLALKAAGDAEDAPPETNLQDVRALRAMHDALEAFMPTLKDVNIETLDAMRASLPDIARSLHARGLTASDMHDLHLYLTYTKQPTPRPEAVADIWEKVGADPDFRAWRERKAEAERLWRHIVRKSGFAVDSVIGQAMRQATPVDMNGALVVLADARLDAYFQRYWQQKSAYLLNDTAYPEDLPIQFISHET